MRRGNATEPRPDDAILENRFVPVFHRTVQLHQFPVRGVHVVVERHV